MPNSVFHSKLFYIFYRRVGGRGGVLACSPHGINSWTSLVDELISQSLFTWMTIGPGVGGFRSATRYAELGIPGVDSSSPLMMFHCSCCLAAGEGTVTIGLLILLWFVGVFLDRVRNGRKMGRQAQRMAMAGSAMFQIMVLIEVSEKRMVADVSFWVPSEISNVWGEVVSSAYMWNPCPRIGNLALERCWRRHRFEGEESVYISHSWEKRNLGRLTVTQARKLHTRPLSAFEAFGGSRPCELAAPGSKNWSQRWKPQIIRQTGAMAGIGRLNSIDS